MKGMYMKIIGKTQKGYILDASEDEVANLIGYYGEYSLREQCGKLNIGDEIQISRMYEQLYKLHDNHKDIERAKECLTQCIENMEEVLPVIHVSIKP